MTYDPKIRRSRINSQTLSPAPRLNRRLAMACPQIRRFPPWPNNSRISHGPCVNADSMLKSAIRSRVLRRLLPRLLPRTYAGRPLRRACKAIKGWNSTRPVSILLARLAIRESPRSQRNPSSRRSPVQPMKKRSCRRTGRLRCPLFSPTSRTRTCCRGRGKRRHQSPRWKHPCLRSRKVHRRQIRPRSLITRRSTSGGNRQISCRQSPGTATRCSPWSSSCLLPPQ